MNRNFFSLRTIMRFGSETLQKLTRPCAYFCPVCRRRNPAWSPAWSRARRPPRALAPCRVRQRQRCRSSSSPSSWCSTRTGWNWQPIHRIQTININVDAKELKRQLPVQAAPDTKTVCSNLLYSTSLVHLISLQFLNISYSYTNVETPVPVRTLKLRNLGHG